MKWIIGTILIIVFALGIGILYGSFNRNAQSKKTNPPINKTLPKEVTITLDKNGFTPKEVTINPGAAVRWKNVSGKDQTVNSDDYPSNQLHKELNFGVFKNNSTVVYIFKTPDTYGFHNQFHPEQKGKVIVTK